MFSKDRGGCVGEFVDSIDAFPSDKKRILANLDCTEKNEKENAIHFANATFLLSPPPPFFVYLALLRLFRFLIAHARRYAIPSAACYATTAVDVMFLLIFFFIVCETTREHVSTVAVCLVVLRARLAHFHEKLHPTDDNRRPDADDLVGHGAR